MALASPTPSESAVTPAPALKWPLVVLVCLGVWLHAADALVATTVMPSAIGEIGGIAYVYWTLALYELGSIVAGAATGLLAVRLGLFAAWGGLAGQVFGALVDLPGPANEPGRPPVDPWHAWAFATLIVFVVPATIGSFYLVWKGLKD